MAAFWGLICRANLQLRISMAYFAQHYCTNTTYSSCHVTCDTFEEMDNSSNLPGTCDILENSSLQKKFWLTLVRCRCPTGGNFFEGLSRSSFFPGTCDISQKSSLQTAPWCVTWRVGRITTVPFSKGYPECWCCDTSVGISEFGSLGMSTPHLVLFWYILAIFVVIPNSFVTLTTMNLSAHVWGVIFHTNEFTAQQGH